MAILSTLKPAEGVCEAVFATSCDVPLLSPAFIREVCGGLTDDVAAAVPRSEGYLHPPAAAYRIDAVLPHLERLVAARKLAKHEHAGGVSGFAPPRRLRRGRCGLLTGLRRGPYSHRRELRTATARRPPFA